MNKIPIITLPRRLREGLHEADKLLEQGKAAVALKVLQELDKRYPNQTYVLERLAEAYDDLGDHLSSLGAIYRLHRLTPNRPHVKLALADACAANMFPALALITFREFLKRWPRDEQAGEVKDNIEKLEKVIQQILPEVGLNPETDLEFVSQHEESQICMNTGELSRAKSLIEKMQRRLPTFVPALNNLSQIYWVEGDLPRAIETCERVLAIEADNLHAMANLVRFLYLTGRKEEAAPLVERLKTSTAQASNRWQKLAETLAFIGDDAGLVELAAQAKKEAQPIELNEYFYHFVAVSECLLGKEKQARDHWNHALKLNPNFIYAIENLNDLKKPAHERNGPWAFPLPYLLPSNTIREMIRLIEREAKSKGKENFQAVVRRFLDEHPELLQMAPLLLERGDANAKEYVLNMADMSGHPDLLSLLKEYAFSQRGSDESRLNAAQLLSKFNVLPPGKTTLWLRGKWEPTLMLGFEITPEPMTDEFPLNQKTIKLMGEAIQALRAKDGARAEGILRKALAIQPEHPGLLNNLALALEMQGKKEEFEAIFQHITNDFPHYFIGQMTRARKAIYQGDLESARNIVNHWMETKRKYHVTEFNILCQVQIDLFLREDNIEGALSWLEIWESTKPEDEHFKEYQERLKTLKLISKIKSRTRRKNKTS